MPTDAHGNFVGKRLVIFGAGYVGGAVAAEAVVRRMRVTALTRNESKAAALREVGVETVVADLATEAWHEQIAGGADFVLNCVSSGGRELAGYEQSYFAGMNSIVAWAQARGAVVANALSGGPWLLGDDLGELPAERRALALTPGAVALRGALPRPIGEVPVSGIDASPVVERLLPDDAVPTMWRVGPDHVALYNGSTVLVATSAPPGTEVLTGATATAWHDVVLEPGEGQLWRLR